MAKIFPSNLNYLRFLISIVFINLVIFANTASAQNSCINADFSMSDFSYWTGSTGMNSAGDYNSIAVGIVQGTTNSGPTDPGRQTIINLPVTDPNTGGLLSMLPPDGSYSARLGNANSNYQAERLAYSLLISPTNCNFTYQSAIVLQDPGTSHTIAEQPKFTFYVKDASGVVVNNVWGHYEVYAEDSIPGFNYYNDIRWKDWTSVSLNLSAFIGQTLTFEFTTYDCAQGAHFGYAYISCYCGVPQLSQQCLGDSVIVTAPIGFSSYLWDNGDTTQSTLVVNPIAGDSVSCTFANANDTITLSTAVSTIPVTGLTATSDVICKGDTVVITASGTYSYLWSNGETAASIQVAPTITTTYTVTATSSGGCTNSAESIVTVNPLPNGTLSSTPSYCGNPDGTITFTPTAGTAPFSYVWSTSPQQTTQTATGLIQGSYTVSITDSNGCSSIKTANVTNSLSILFTATATNERCGNADGTATITITEGIPPYSYVWSTVPPQYTATVTGLSAGTYYVTVSDAMCTTTATLTVLNMAGPVVQISNTVNATCGQSNGGATVTVISGNQPYTYQWNSSPPQFSSSLQNVPAGIYCATVTDTYCYSVVCDTILNEAYQSPEICLVTVDTASNHNMIVWEKPVTNGIDKYYIFRESAVAGIYNLIGEQNYADNSIFIDTTSNSLQQSYRYKLAIYDLCGFISQQSDYHQTVHLSINAGMSGEWNLIWNNYEGFTFGTYNIYRGTNAGNLSLLTSISSNFTSYTDLTPPLGIVYYLIEAIKPTACNPSKTTNSITSTISNIADNQGLGISEFETDNFIQISPNPGNGIFSITLNQFPDKGLEIEVYNSLGQIVKKDVQNTLTKIIDISDYPRGIYFVKIFSDVNSFAGKIVIE
jgi:hypothetical protein